MPFYDQNGQPIGYDPSGYGGQTSGLETPADFGQYATLGGAIQKKKGLIGPALMSGAYDLAGTLGAGVGAVGGAINNDAIRDWGIAASDAMQARSQAAGRPDLETMPWRDDWSQQGKTLADVPAWAAYQVAKQVPQIAGMMAGGAVVGGGLRAAGIAAPGAEMAAALPEWMGGGGLKAGMSVAEQQAARKAGADLAQQYMGTTVAGMPQAAGSMYQSEVDRSREPGQPGLSQGAAMQALGMAPLYSALDAMTPSESLGIIKRGMAGKIGRRMATAALSEGAQEMVQEGLQTGMEMSFRPDLPMAQKAQNIVDAALVGGLVGGVLGGVSGIRRSADTHPNNIPTEQIARDIDEEQPRPGSPAPQNAQPPSAPSLGDVSNSIKNLKGQNPSDTKPVEWYLDALAAHGLGDDKNKLTNPAKKVLTEWGLLGKNADGVEELRNPTQAVEALRQQLDEAKQALATTQSPAQRPHLERRVERLTGLFNMMEKVAAVRPTIATSTTPAAPAAPAADTAEAPPPPPPPPTEAEVAAYNASARASDEEAAASAAAAGVVGVDEETVAPSEYPMPPPPVAEAPAPPSNGAENSVDLGQQLAEARVAEQRAGLEEKAQQVSDLLSGAPPELDIAAQMATSYGGNRETKPRPVREEEPQTEYKPSMTAGLPSRPNMSAKPLKQDLARASVRNTQGKTNRANLDQPKIVTTPEDQASFEQASFEQAAREAGRPAAAVSHETEAAPAAPAAEKPITRVGPEAVLSTNGKQVSVKNPNGKPLETAVFHKTQITQKTADGQTNILKPGQMQGVSPELATAAQAYFDAKTEDEKKAAKEAVRQAIDAPYLAAEYEVQGRAIPQRSAAPANVGANAKTGREVPAGNPAGSQTAAPRQPKKQLSEAERALRDAKRAEKLARDAAVNEEADAEARDEEEEARLAAEERKRKAAERAEAKRLAEEIEKSKHTEAVETEISDLKTKAMEADLPPRVRDYFASLTSNDFNPRVRPVLHALVEGKLNTVLPAQEKARASKKTKTPPIDKQKAMKMMREALARSDDTEAVKAGALRQMSRVIDELNHQIELTNTHGLQQKELENTATIVRKVRALGEKALGIEKGGNRAEEVLINLITGQTAKTKSDVAERFAKEFKVPSLVFLPADVTRYIDAKIDPDQVTLIERNYSDKEWVRPEHIVVLKNTADPNLDARIAKALAKNKAAEAAARITEKKAQKDVATELNLLNQSEIMQVRGPAGEHQVAVKGKSLPILGMKTLGEMHKELLGLSQSKALRQLSPLINRLRNLPVFLAPHADLNMILGGGHAYFDRANNHIVMPGDARVNADQRAHWLLHEAVHAALAKYLAADPQAQAELRRIAKALKNSGLVGEDDYAFSDAQEFLAEVLSRPSLQRALAKLEMPNNLTGWRWFVGKVMDWLGFKGPKTALEGVMQVKDYLERVASGPLDMQKMLEGVYGKNGVDKILSDAANAENNARVLAVASRMIMSGADTAIGRLTGWLDDNFNAGPQTLKFRAAQTELYWSSYGHMLNKFGKMFDKVVNNKAFNPLRNWGDAMNQRVAITARLARLFGIEHDRLEELEKANPGLRLKEKLSTLMSISTEFGLDPERPWESDKAKGIVGVKDMPHIKQIMAMDRDRAALVKGEYDRAVQLYKDLNRHAQIGNRRNIYHAYRDLNAMLLNSSQAVTLYNLVRSDPYFAESASYASSRPSLKAVREDPVEAFLNNKALHDNPLEAAQFWRGEVDKRLRDINTYLAHMTVSKNSLSKEDWENYEHSKKPLVLLLKELEDQLKTMEEAPYFHLGRHGDFMVRFTMPVNTNSIGTEEEQVDKETIKKVSERLSQIDPDVMISFVSNRPAVLARFESKDKADRFLKAVQQLKAEGLVKTVHNDTRSNVRGNEANQPAWLSRYIEALQTNSALNEEQRRHMVSTARAIWLDQLSDTAVARVMAQRQTVPGYNKDMLRNFAFRAEVGINSLANLSVSAKVSEAFRDMDEMRKDASYKDHAKSDAMTRVLQELQQRDADRPLTTGKSWIDTWRAINQAFFLGMSPAYTLVNMSQLGVMLLPELAKKHGFVKSARAMGAVTSAAFRIIRETYAEGRKISFSRALDAIITSDVLERALPGDQNKEMRDFLTRMVNSGNIDLGSPMRELGRRSDGIESGKVDYALRFASAMGYYSETFTRLIAAMSAHELMKGQRGMTDAKMDRYAGDVLNEAMLNYSNWYTARATGKTGILGQFTPIPASFQQYTLQVFQKLYRELGEAFTAKQDGEKNEDYLERKNAARKFLFGHAAALTLLAGSLGLPFTTVAMRAADFLRDLFDDDDEPHDTRTDYRNFLALVFGKEVGEVLARGLPRAAGFDISGRVGEQDMAPFSRFIADRRKMEDASKDLVFRSVGSPVSMVAGMVNGGWEMAQGNFLRGLQMMVPNSIKGGLKAYDMATKGYEDVNGTPLPMQADPGDVIWQALGFNPAEKAEYTEANLARSTRKTLLQREAGVLRNDLVQQANEGGFDADTLSQAKQFDIQHPEYAILPSLGATINRRKEQAMMARRFGMPLGVKPSDLDERRRLGFANF